MIRLHPQKQSGFALVLVLLSLVLLLSIAVGFFLSVTAERQSSHVDASAMSVRELADSTLNVVIAQIKDGSSGFDQSAPSPAPTVAWASQPGLIRTYEAAMISSANSTGQYQAYKLYSSPKMIVTSVAGSAAWDPQADVPPATWASSPALYTDMNAPINRLDPNGTVTIGGQKFSTIYPIVDPTAATGANAVKGFSISASTPTAGTTNPAPMPVQWLYELQDGTLISGVSTGTTTVTVAGASSSNPIVARVAFWTDDDSCKVNVNTAAGDLWVPDTITKTSVNTEMNDAPCSFWDVPRLNCDFDESGLQNNIQARNEFQRYPGHPATTYLSAVFPSLTRAQIAAIAPRIQLTGSSQGGTMVATAVVTPDSDRLYSSVDELAFAQPASGATNRTLQSAITPAQIEQTRFFLTAHSRAPELNLFGGPRVTIWPIPSTTTNQTTFDQTVALCSTIGGKAYYYVRSDPSSPTVDLNLSRNPTVYGYLQTAMGLTYPKFGGNFAAKFGADTNQILTEIFDYIRCVNLVDSSPGAKPYADGITGTSTVFGQGTVVPTANPNGTYGLGRFPINTQFALNLWLNPAGQMVPYIILSKFCPMQGFANMYPSFVETITGLDSLAVSYNYGRTPPSPAFTPLGFPHTAQSTIYSSYWVNQSVRCFGGNLGMGAEFWDNSSPSKLLIPGVNYPFSGTPQNAPAGKCIIENANPTTPITITISPVGSPTTIIQSYSLIFPQYSYMWVPTSAGAYNDFSVRVHGSIHNYFSGINGSSGDADSLMSLELSGPQVLGDYRIAALLASTSGGIPKTEFLPHQLYDPVTKPVPISNANIFNFAKYMTPYWQAGSLRDDQSYSVGASSTEQSYGSLEFGAIVPRIPYQTYYNGGWNVGSNNPPYPDFPSSLSQAAVGGAQLKSSGAFTASGTAPGSPGDWDNGVGDTRQGAYAGKADEGASGLIPYFHSGGVISSTIFSPNRQISSAVAFGSLPTGFARKYPWQTLLFCPNPLSGSVQDSSVTAYTSYIANHPGRLNTPPDYLMLDLFTMPVVEPYAISEPFSTAGKVNLNYQIVPFTYITRSTALQAVLHSTRVTALDTNAVCVYHNVVYNGNNTTSYYGPNFRYPINLSETLSDFDARFSNNRPFVSATEICDMYMVPDISSNSIETGTAPTGNTHSNPVAAWWSTGGNLNLNGYHAGGTVPTPAAGQGFYLTGSNERQKPYADIYPRLTTQSNTYTVHVRVQKLKVPSSVAAGSWDESAGVIEGEYRGSYSVERYIDPNDSRFASNGGSIDPDSANLNQLYKFRIVETKKFAP